MVNDTASWLIDRMEAWAPLHWAESWDNVGLLLGDVNTLPVRKVLVALDVTEAVVDEVVSGGYDFLICHHPLIHDPIRKITSETPQGRKLLVLLSRGVRLYCAHTNLDKAPGGVNDCLFEKLGLQGPTVLMEEGGESPGIGLVGQLERPMRLGDFAAYVKKALDLAQVRFSGDADVMVKTVGLCGGDASGPIFWKAALEKNCRVFITGDLRFHSTQDAWEAGIAMVDVSHYGGEKWIIDAIVKKLRKEAKATGRDILIEATKTNGQIFSQV